MKNEGHNRRKVLSSKTRPTPLLIRSSTRRRISLVNKTKVSTPRLKANGAPSSCSRYLSSVRNRLVSAYPYVIPKGPSSVNAVEMAATTTASAQMGGTSYLRFQYNPLTAFRGYDRCCPRWSSGAEGLRR